MLNFLLIENYAQLYVGFSHLYNMLKFLFAAMWICAMCMNTFAGHCNLVYLYFNFICGGVWVCGCVETEPSMLVRNGGRTAPRCQNTLTEGGSIRPVSRP